MSNIHEEEALGKAYDSRLMKRLLDYMRPYRWRVIIALALVAIVTPLELAPPLLFKKTIDDYLVPALRGPAARQGVERSVADQPGLSWRAHFRLPGAVHPDPHHAASGSADDVRHADGDIRRLQRLPMSYFDRNPVAG